MATERQGVLLLGLPLGPHFVAAQLQKISEEHERFTSHIPSLPDVQAAWLLLVHCANARANHMLRVVPPVWVAVFARAHDARLWSCLFHILGIAEDTCDDMARATASLVLAMEGLGLRSAARTNPSAFWTSWADCLPIVQKRHPEVATHNVEMLSNHPSTPCLEAAVQAAEGLHALPGFSTNWLWAPGHLRGNLRRTSQEPPAPGGNTRLPHGPRLFVCQAPNASICVSPNAFIRVSPNAFICVSPNAFICVSPNAFIRVSPNALTRVSPNASAEFATELASLAYLCSLRSHVF